MLMRFSQVSKEGVYSKPIHPKLAYGGMTAVRTTLINHSALSMARGSYLLLLLRFSILWMGDGGRRNATDEAFCLRFQLY
jgi:hypothetical protein